jgi:hypothetical protein
MRYSGLYRCSGCSVTFSDPVAWRQASQVGSAAEGPEEPNRASAAADDNAVLRPRPPVSSVHFSGIERTPGDPLAYGNNPEDLKAILEAATAANRSKGRRR